MHAVGTLRVYHGTTGAAAEHLRTQRSRALDIGQAIREVATRVGVDEMALAEAAKGYYVRDGYLRDAFSVTMHPGLARLYAGRVGGEAYHQLTGLALRLRDPALDTGAADDEATRLVGDQPAVLTLEVPFERFVNESLPGRRRTPWTFDEWVEHAAGLGDDVPANNVRVLQPVEPAWVVDVALVEPVVPEFALHRWIPTAEVMRLMSSKSRPPSVGPPFEGIYEMSAVRSWLNSHGLEAIQ